MTDTAKTQVDSVEDFAKSPDGALTRWKSEIELAKKEFEPYWKRCDEITDRYRMETENGEVRKDDTLCLLWAQVNTEIPAIYQRRPQPQVSRRFKAKAVPARVASLILERYLSVDIDRDGIDGEAEAMVRSYLLYDRAVAWLDVEPKFATGEDGQERAVDLRAPVRYLSPRDFLHSPSPSWRQVTWVARRHFFTRDAAVKKFAEGMRRFGWQKTDLPLDCEPQYGNDEMKKSAGDVFKRATVWEVHDEASGMILFVHTGMQVFVDVKPMPTKLESRFPAPEPCYGTVSDGSLVPVPAYIQWQQLAEEIDDLSKRIRHLTQAVRIAGAYDGSNDALGKIFTTTDENELVPVENWRAFTEKGGVVGAVQLVDIAPLAAALQTLSEQRQQRIDMLNQLTGFNDVMRGQGDPRATATQEKIKNNYGSLRLQEKQADFTRFMDRILRVKAEIIAELCPPEVLVSVSDAQELPEAQDPQILMAAVQLLKDDKLRDFRLEVQERSMAAIDEAEEKQHAAEFVGSLGDLLAKAAGAPPEMMDFAAEAALFIAKRHRVGRELEGTVEGALQAIKQKAEAARQQPPQPPPQVMAEGMRHKNALAELDKKHQLEMVRLDKDAERTDRLENAQMMSQQRIEEFKAFMANEREENKARWQAWLDQQKMQHEAQLAEYEARIDARLKSAEMASDERLERMRAENDRASQMFEQEGKQREVDRQEREARRKQKRRVRIDDEVFDAQFLDEPGTLQ